MQTPQNIAPTVPDRGALNGEILTDEQIIRMDRLDYIRRRLGVTTFRVSLADQLIVTAEPVVPHYTPDAHVIGASRANLSQMGR
ncbi:hypothetical protein D2T31_11925 [Sinirhodobacter populi]|uniref:Uncharacterized protein n=1 Tax=Paenirhodobacter populi TaxID=2306993 RepID=A0A443K7S7_9RHOB|nr:hypothetical protein [Sinirhodobacter populi]RWR28814.1 hypothetical protein D2T31_11925 [Sinirhodobacter populi]